MTERERHLREMDVRKIAPTLEPSIFLQAYMRSNFPQTAVMPSPHQKEYGLLSPMSESSVQLKQKSLGGSSGTSFDNPALS